MQAYEKLGLFYLGRTVGQGNGGTAVLLYDSKDLVTHAICVGMTGSGKTGLCIDLLEEAAIDGVPSLVIDPKGDLGESAADVPVAVARRVPPLDRRGRGAASRQDAGRMGGGAGRGVAEGPADWDQDGDRIRRLRAAADFAIYTPGSQAGLPLSILNSFAAPAADLVGDTDLMRERVATTATSLLGLARHRCRSGEEPRAHPAVHPHRRGVAPGPGPDDRVAHSDGAVAAGAAASASSSSRRSIPPTSGSSWPWRSTTCSPHRASAPGPKARRSTCSGCCSRPRERPRLSILSIAHLNDAERMFFVTLLLNQVLGWMRKQPGTTSLRAIVYMDEIAGYLPPVAMPASKGPLLTLLKQARAFGVGMVLATQNPVDLDYKALSNAGTWLIGRLQTERDQSRLIDGLESVDVERRRRLRSRRRQPHDRRSRQAPVPAPQRPRGSSRTCSRAGGRCRTCADRSRGRRSRR